MSKVRKSILIIGILLIIVAASLATALALFATGTIKTDPVELVFSVKDEQKEYDGTPLKATEFRLTEGQLNEGDTAQVEILGSQTAVGTSQSDLSVKIYDREGYNVTNNYSIRVESGELTVTKKFVSIDLPSQKAVYNGTTVALTNYKIAEDSEGELVVGHRIFGSTDGGLLNVGDTVDRDLTPLIFDAAGNDVTENYEIYFSVGEIEVIPRHLSIRPVSVSKVYDGTQLVADKIEFVEGTLAEGQYIKYKINDDLTNASLDATVVETRVTEVQIFATVDGKEIDVTENYEIDTFETGVLEITPRPLTVTAKSASWTYDGEEHSLKGDITAFSVEGLAPFDELREVEYISAITDVGKVTNVINNVWLTCRSDNYNITTINGTLEITPFDMVVTTATAEKYYDGEPLTDVTVNGLTANGGHTVEKSQGSAVPSITNAGSINNSFECSVLDRDGNDVTENYHIEYRYGTLTVKKRPVTATLGKGNGVERDEVVEYNGKEQKPDLMNADYFRLTSVEDAYTAPLALTGSDFEVVSLSRYMIDAGEYAYTVKFTDWTLVDNYELYIPSNGYFTITAKPLSITTEGDRRVYNGNPLTNGSYSFGDGTECVSGHAIKLPEILPSITDVGEIANDYVITVRDENGTDVTKNYDVTYDYGKLQVTPLSVTVRLQTAELKRDYTGKVITLAPEDVITQILSADGLLTASDFVVTYESEVVNVKRDAQNRTAAYSYSVKIADSHYAENFTLTVTNEGKLVVDPAAVTVSVKDINQVYDGQVHYLDAYSAIYSVSDPCNVLTRDNFKVTFNSQNAYSELINAGEYAYTVEITERELSNNYQISVNNAAGGNAGNYPAKYVIEKFTVNITVASKTFVYDGEAHTSSEYSSTALANSKHVLSCYAPNGNVFTSVTNVGQGKVKNDLSFAVFDSDSPTANDITNTNYIISVTEGYLQVTARAVTVRTSDGISTYNGEEYSYTEDVKVIGIEGFTAEYDGGNRASITNVGVQSNIFGCTIQRDGEDVTENFEITYVYGTIQIIPLGITVTLKDIVNGYDAEFNYIDLIYSGEKKTVDVHTVIGSVVPASQIEDRYLPKEDAFEIVYNGGMVDAGIYSYSLRFNDGNYAKNFDANFVDGTITINKLTVSIELANGYYTYNGKAIVLGSNMVKGSSVGEALLPLSVLSFNEISGNVIKNAGTYTYGAYLAEQEYSKNITVDCQPAEIVISPLTVNVTLKSYEFIFDNTERSVNVTDAIQNIDSDLLKNEDFSIALIGGKAVKNAGNYGYNVVVTDRTYAQNFDIQCTDGTISVSKLTVNVSLENFTFTYNGHVQSVSVKEAVNLDTNLVTVTNFTVTVDGDAVNAGTYTYSAEINAEADNEYYNNFDFVYGADGSIEIKPLGVTVSLASFTKVYDGGGYTVSAAQAVSADTSLVGADDFVITGADNIRNAGLYTYGVALRDYITNFTLNNPSCTGSVTVERADVSVQLKNKTITYGNIYTPDKTELIGNISSDSLDSSNFTIVMSDADNESVGNHYFTVTLDDAVNYRLTVLNSGCITVKPRAVTITTQGDTFEYNGQPYSLSEEVGLENAVAGHKAVVVSPVSITDAGSIKNELVCRITDALNNDVTDNYTITYIYGTLTVKPLSVNVTLKDFQLDYKGARHEFGVDAAIDEISTDLLKANDFSLSYSAPFINAGSYSYSVSLNNGNQGNYVISISGGTVEIKKATLYVSLESYEATYAGKAIAVPYSEEKFSEVVNLGDNYDDLGYSDFKIITYGEMKNAGEYEFGIEFANSSLYNNYNLFVTNGMMTVKAAQISVALKDYSFVYSGKSVTLDAASAIEGISGDGAGLITNSQFSIVYNGEARLVGNYTYSVEITSAEIANNFVLDDAIEGKIEITKRLLKFTLADLVMSEYATSLGYNSEFDVTNLISVSSGTPLADGDSIIIYKAYADGDSLSRTMKLGSFLEGSNFTLTNADCYDIQVDNLSANVTLIPEKN